MEDYRIDLVIDTGPNARTVQIDLNPFTLIGATTRSGLLTSPLRARFGINLRLQYYDAKTLTDIVERSAGILDIPHDAKAAYEIASRSRGTPRIANSLLRRVRDFAQIKGDGIITPELTEYALDALQVDKRGLDEMDNRILRALIEKFGGGPVGMTTLATAIGENAGTLEEVYEPFLIQEGLLVRTPRGRQATPAAYKHLGLKPSAGSGKLFE
jgi:Holliday junction DNA helicase RuvB